MVLLVLKLVHGQSSREGGIPGEVCTLEEQIWTPPPPSRLITDQIKQAANHPGTSPAAPHQGQLLLQEVLKTQEAPELQKPEEEDVEEEEGEMGGERRWRWGAGDGGEGRRKRRRRKCHLSGMFVSGAGSQFV